MAVAAPWTARENRSVKKFDRIVFDTVGDLHIGQAAQEGLVVEAEPKVQSKISTVVRNGELRFSTIGEPLVTRVPIRYWLTVKSLSSIRMQGGGDVHAKKLVADTLRVTAEGSGDLAFESLEAESVEIELSGAGSISVSRGAAERLSVIISGSGDYEATQMMTRRARVSITGSGAVSVAASEELDARISGSGSIRYRGRPKVHEEVSGAGSVEPL